MGEPEVEAFSTWLGVDRKVAKSTQKGDTTASHRSILQRRGRRDSEGFS